MNEYENNTNNNPYTGQYSAGGNQYTGQTTGQTNGYGSTTGSQGTGYTYGNTYSQNTYSQGAYNQNAYGSQSGYTQSQYSQAQYSQPVKPVKQKKKHTFLPKLLAGVAIGLAFGACAGLGFYAVNTLTGSKIETASADTNSTEIAELEKTVNDLQLQIAASSGSDATVTTTQTSGNQTVTTVTTDVTAVVDKVMPSMVSITNLYEETTSYFGRNYTQEAQASGSGIIIGENDTEYLVVTNYHVIENCVQLTVQFTDSTEATANVKGYDESMDIAVISVLKSDLSADTISAISIAELGDSDALKIGEPAIAIGNALGYGQSVTTGVISAVNRDLGMEDTYDSLIQTSAAINPGNSGGALLNIAGQVIGINSNKIGATTVEGMGYAIPINAVKDLITDFSNRETKYKVDEDERGYLGISGVTVDSTTASTYGIPEGVYVSGIYQNSAAQNAGITTGDVITRVDGQSVSTIAELQELLTYYKGGDTVTLTVERAGNNGYEEQEVTVTLSGKTVFDSQQ